MQKKYFQGLDNIKGFLILMVFLGHIFVDPHGRLAVYIIYSFHMPLFIGISGFLFNYKKTISETLYYFINRLMVPWIIAVICYFYVNIKVYNYDCSLKALIMNFISPFCHLWYIPAIIFYTFTFYVMIRLLHNTKCCWIIIGGISLLICMISYYIEHNYLYGHKVLSILHNNLRLYNFIYFSSGALLKKILSSEDNKIQNIKFVKIISFCLFLFYLLFYFFDFITIKTFVYVIFNCLLIIVVLCDCVCDNIRPLTFLAFIGQYSLPIYLYHILCDNVGTILFGQGSFGYYICSTICFAILVLIIYLMRNFKLIRRFVYGMN